MTIKIDDPENLIQRSQDEKFALGLRRCREANPNGTIEEIAAKMGYAPDNQFRENVRRAERRK
jgi:hypothetical protein